jgi:hypothetical protein
MYVRPVLADANDLGDALASMSHPFVFGKELDGCASLPVKLHNRKDDPCYRWVEKDMITNNKNLVCTSGSARDSICGFNC